MSEYQYYEFRTLDRPLTPEQMSHLRTLSSRAEITSRSFTNTYNYGDFRGNPRKLMETHFDAHVYVSNFGTLTFMLRLPRTVLPEETLARYAIEDGLTWWTTDEHTIVEWQRNEEPFDDWMEGGNWMDRLLPLRDELVRGDYRSFYIGWLAAIAQASEDDDEDEAEDEIAVWEEDEEEVEDGEDPEDDEEVRSAGRREPPVPSGLAALTVAQTALSEFLGVDSDLLTVAAAESPDVAASADSDAQAVAWVAQLPEKEVRNLLVRVLKGEGMRVETELQSRYFRSRNAADPDSGAKARRGGRTAAQLLALAAEAERERKQQEAAARDRKRHAYLKGLVPRFPELWTTVNALAEEQKAAAYGKACAVLLDLRDAYDHAGRSSEFQAEIAGFIGRNTRRSALIREIRAAQLMP
jgi:hypothetical protein